MIRKGLWTGAAFAAAVLASGCQSDEYAPEVHPKKYAFEGKKDPRFVGTWATANGNSTLQLKKDGTMQITSVEHSMKGRTVEKVFGEWLANADSIMFRYASGAQQPVVVKYMDSLSGNTMKLQQPGLKTTTTYHKK